MDLLSCSQLSSITYTRHMSCFLCELLNFFFVFFFRSFCSACVSLENSARQETTKKSRKINKQNVTVWIVAVSMRFSFIKLEEEERILASFLFTLSHAEGERKFRMMKFFSYFLFFYLRKRFHETSNFSIFLSTLNSRLCSHRQRLVLTSHTVIIIISPQPPNCIMKQRARKPLITFSQLSPHLFSLVNRHHRSTTQVRQVAPAVEQE